MIKMVMTKGRRRLAVTVVLLTFACVARAEGGGGEPSLLVHWTLTKGGVTVAQNSFDPRVRRPEEWRDIRQYEYPAGCPTQGAENPVKFGQHIWINSGAIVNKVAAMDVIVEARGLPDLTRLRRGACEVVLANMSEHNASKTLLVSADEESIADQWDDYRLVIDLVPR